MPDYRKYCSTAGVTNGQMVAALKAAYPMYSKATQTMICNPENYAVRLLDEAEALLVSAFGYAPGLAMPDPEEIKKIKFHGNKKKPNRLYVRLNDELMERVRGTMERMHFVTMQDLVEAALFQFVDRYEGGWR